MVANTAGAAEYVGEPGPVILTRGSKTAAGSPCEDGFAAGASMAAVRSIPGRIAPARTSATTGSAARGTEIQRFAARQRSG
jgi:hypothetical protein